MLISMGDIIFPPFWMYFGHCHFGRDLELSYSCYVQAGPAGSSGNLFFLGCLLFQARLRDPAL